MWLYKVLEIYIFITLWITVLYYNNHPYCPNRNKGIELFVASIITIVTGIYDSRWRVFSRPRLPAIARKYRPWYSCHNSTTYLLSQFCFLSVPSFWTGLFARWNPRSPPHFYTRFNVIYSCRCIGRWYTCACKWGERWRPVERESPIENGRWRNGKKVGRF